MQLLEALNIDKELVRKRFRSAAQTYDVHAPVQQEMAKALVELARPFVSEKVNRVLEIGCGTGLLTRQLLNHYAIGEFFVNDLVPEAADNIAAIVSDYKVPRMQFMEGDIEIIDLPQQVDVIWSGATIQWVDDLEGFFNRAARALNSDGHLVLSSFGRDNYKEIKAITGFGIEYKSMEAVVESAAQHYEPVAMKAWTQAMYFSTPCEVLKHMRYTGVNGVASTSWTRRDVAAFESSYQTFRQSEGYPLTYHPYLLVLKKRSLIR
ncbi:malonyl-[acyl-carrier protein] O-methyltransferase BioC [Marinilabiliaceae bacterium JC017]|nr:malonyl-[acyl-carrier protein] O-methyltransferase BioC [Marinilabiliaceae bacterium JC017]